MKPIIALSLLLASTIPAGAFTVTDSATGEALPGASVFNRSGSILGITDAAGDFPTASAVDFPLTIRYIGYEPRTLAVAADTIGMTATALPLSEVTVTDRVDGAHIICYMREYCSATTSTDTANFIIERMVDYIVPLRKDVKKFKEQRSPRTLAKRATARYTSADGTDSVADNPDTDIYSWSFFCTLDDFGIAETEAMRGLNSATDTIDSKKAPILLRKNGGTLTATIDYLADKKDHTWSPAALKLLGATTDFTEIQRSQAFAVSDDGRYPVNNFAANTFAMQALGRGKLMKRMFRTSEPVQMRSLIEAYPVDCTYITAEESSRLHKSAPTPPPFPG